MRPKFPPHFFTPRTVTKASTLLALVALTCLMINRGEPQRTYTPDTTYRLTILNTSDASSWNGLPPFHNSPARALELARRQQLIDQTREEVEADGGHLLLLSGGEINASDNQASLNRLNQLGYNAMAVSPMLFNEPLTSIRQQESMANFPFLSANLYESETGKPLFDAYALFDFDGLRVAVMGLTTTRILLGSKPKYRRGLELIDPLVAAHELVPQLKRQADVIIVTTYDGHRVGTGKGHKLAQSAPIETEVEGIDLVVGDHALETEPTSVKTQQVIKNIRQNTANCSMYVNRTDLEFRNGILTTVHRDKINLNDRKEPALGGSTLNTSFAHHRVYY